MPTRSPAEISTREFVEAKLGARKEAIGDWFADDNHMMKTITAVTGTFVTVAAGAELAAHRLRNDGTSRALLGRAGLHLAAVAASAAAGLGLEIHGYVAGQIKAEKEAEADARGHR